MATNTTDILIIGSGVSSLTCGAILSKYGYHVTILEQHRKIGGYLHCFDRFGCRFDTGAHYVGAIDEGEPFWALLNYLGIFNADIFTPLDRDGFDVFRFPEGDVSLACGHDEAVRQLSAQFPNEKAGIRKYFSFIKAAGEAFATYRFNPNTSPEAAIEFIETPLKSVVESCVTAPVLQAFFYGYCGLHCVAPSDTPFGFHAVMIDSLLRGAYGFRNGGDHLAMSLVKGIKNQGGEVYPRKKVIELPVKDGRVTEVTCADGSRFRAKHVITSSHPKQVFDMIGWDHFRPSFKNRVTRIPESCPLFGVYAAASKPPKIAKDKNYYAFASSDLETFERLSPKNINNLSINEPISVFVVRGRSDEGVTTTNKPMTKIPLTFHSLGPLSWFSDWKKSKFGNRPIDYKRQKEKSCQQVIKFVERNFEGVTDVIEQHDGSTALTNIHYNGSVDGSAYGIYHSIENTGVRAIGPRTKIENLYLTGQNTLFPGILAAAVAGLRTAGQIVELKPILTELKKYLRD